MSRIHGFLEFGLLLGCFPSALCIRADDSTAIARKVQLKAGFVRKSHNVVHSIEAEHAPSEGHGRFFSDGAADARDGKWGKIADFFADISAPITSGLSSASRYFAPGSGYGAVHHADEMYEKNFVVLAMTFLIIAAFSALIAHYYELRKHAASPMAGRQPDPERVPISQWAARDVLDPRRWLEEKEVCFMSCCCPCIRWADTLSSMNIIAFWHAFLAYLLLAYLDAITTGTVFWLALVLLCTYYRSKIRETFGLSPVTWSIVLADCCCFCWCMPCYLAQEARNVDKAVREARTVESGEMIIEERYLVKEHIKIKKHIPGARSNLP